MEPSSSVLVCDDDLVCHKSLRRVLGDDYMVDCVTDTEQLAAMMAKNEPDLVLLDVQLRSEREGLAALPLLRRRWPWVPVVIYSGVGRYSAVVEAIRLGAVDFIPKGTPGAEIVAQLKKVTKTKRAPVTDYGTSMIGGSDATKQLRSIIPRLAAAHCNILVTGESGVGKEVVARSMRKRVGDGFEPFVAIDCATIHGSTAESILFGHVRGSFTGADTARKGLLETANGGVLFLDEIGNLPYDIQAKLLRAIQEKEIIRMGSTKPIKIDFRLVAATNRDLDELVQDGVFRQDLLMRLNAVTVHIESLRQRRQEIREFLTYFVSKHRTGYGLTFDEEALVLLDQYDWPGNVREVANVVDYVSTLCVTRHVTASDLPKKIQAAAECPARGDIPAHSNSLDAIMRSYEQRVLHEFYALAHGNIAEMARRLNCDRSNLRARLKKHGIHNGRILNWVT